MNKNNFQLKTLQLKETHVFRDAIHNYIPIEYDVLLELVNSDAMQRLRRIKQLGGTYQVYQSAEHSRFTHSLGVYAIVRRMLIDSVLKNELNDYDKLTVMCAALLHDIGHGPFSHCFENVFHLQHESYTIQIIQNDKQIYHILEDCVEGLANDVVAIIKKTHPNAILVQMISSQLDADRMDYLLRDSYFTGTTYGQFDLSRILRVMKVCDGKIVYKQSGVQAIENYILARYHMYWQVYYHPTTRSYEQILISLFQRLQDLYDQNKDLGDIRYLEPFLNHHISIQDYLYLDEGIMFYYLRLFTESNDKILQDLSSRFLNRHLLAYQDYQSKQQKQQLEKLCQNKGYDPRYYVLCDDQKQVPYHHYGNSNDISEIQIMVKEQLVALSDISEIVGAITSSNKRKIDQKIFYPK